MLKKSATQTSTTMGEKLIQAVQILQRTILDVHLLFFKLTAVPSLPLLVPGLVILKQLEFINDIDRTLSPLICFMGKQITADASPKGQKKTLGFDIDAFLADDKVCTAPSDIRNIFDQWIARAVLRVGESTRAALEAMDSATEVARLQQRMWLCCTTVNTSAPSPSSISSAGGVSAAACAKPTQTDWEEACVELLAVKRRRTASATATGLSVDKSSGAGAAAASLLWSRVFRLPFMQQVGTLTHTASETHVTSHRYHVIIP